jgi:hypothetical protein
MFGIYKAKHAQFYVVCNETVKMASQYNIALGNYGLIQESEWCDPLRIECFDFPDQALD